LDVGTLPSVAPGVGGEVVVRIDALDLRVRGAWLSLQRAQLENPLMIAVDVEWAGGSALACARPFDRGAPEVSFCGGLQAGAFVATGRGVSSPGSAAVPSAALAFSAAIPWSPLAELDLEASLDLVVPLGAPTFVIEPFGSVFTPAPVSGRLSITGHIDVR
jgi:hypothetical protein